MTGVSAKPEKEFKVGAVHAAIWSNPRRTGDGRMFNSQKVILERVYRDNMGNFKSTYSLEISDIPKAILALKKAYEYLVFICQKSTTAENGDPRDFKAPERIP